MITFSVRNKLILVAGPLVPASSLPRRLPQYTSR
jgi:hypothetical protein